MRQKILNQVAVLLLGSVFITFLVVSLVMYNKFTGYMQTSVQEETEYIKVALEENVSADVLKTMGALAENNRITLLNQEGKVLYDSFGDETHMENHKDRPEIADAAAHGTGEKLRYSSTLSKQTYYYAVRLKDGRILRLSQSISTILIFLSSSITLIGILVFGIILAAFFVIWKQTAKWVEPLNTLDLEHPLKNVEYEELRPLLYRVDQQNKQISRQMQELRERHEEYLAITENMKDGLLITSQTEVLSMNKAAQELFLVNKKECIQKPISRVSENPQLKKSLEQALQGVYDESVLEMNGRSYQILANPVKISGKPYGAVILIWDITEKKEVEQMRREFSANVSHELKTPLMSISGYAELIQRGMVQEKDVPEFAGRIYQEAKRLSALIADIIQLSQLEEENKELPMEEVNIFQMTLEIQNKLEVEAATRNVKLLVEGEDIFVWGVNHILYEMFYNLIDNGIKYNKENGQVKIRIFQEKDGICWEVCDNGIGIAREHMERIYERFYRVDKSHSRQTGGTGLGLSIVKHGAYVHGAVIHTESQPGQGTKICLTFPAKHS